MKPLVYNSVAQGLEIQRDCIARWADKLSAKCYLAVCAEAEKQNKLLTEDSTLINVWRGDHITCFILNWKE